MTTLLARFLRDQKYSIDASRRDWQVEPVVIPGKIRFCLTRVAALKGVPMAVRILSVPALANPGTTSFPAKPPPPPADP